MANLSEAQRVITITQQFGKFRRFEKCVRTQYNCVHTRTQTYKNKQVFDA